jgi:uncharacterized protein YegL
MAALTSFLHLLCLPLTPFQAAAATIQADDNQEASTMRSLLIALTCLVCSSTARTEAPKAPEIEVVFVLDTTGSMSGLIHAAKEKIWSIASSMAQTDPVPRIKMGLVAYRDRGDHYVTQRYDLTADLDGIYDTLMALSANGGGDGPESVNQALHEAVTRMSWSRERDVYRVVFLVGDAPPHMDYQDDIKYPVTCSAAAEKTIVINTIQCGEHKATTPVWRDIAELALGDYFRVGQSGSAVAASTPFDKELARVSAELDATRLYYGSRSTRDAANARKKLGEAINTKASLAAQARRAAFNISEAGAENFLGHNELLDDLQAGRIALSDLETTELPEKMQKLTAAERARFVDQKIAVRAALQKKAKALAAKRQAHIQKQLEKNAAAAKSSFSQKVYDSVRRQAAKSHIHYASESALH